MMGQTSFLWILKLILEMLRMHKSKKATDHEECYCRKPPGRIEQMEKCVKVVTQDSLKGALI